MIEKFLSENHSCCCNYTLYYAICKELPDNFLNYRACFFDFNAKKTIKRLFLRKMTKKGNYISESCEKTCTKKFQYDILLKRGKACLGKL